MRSVEFVFGYASLVTGPGPLPTREPGPLGYVTDLADRLRSWGVAMDNSRDLPGYKYFRLPDGSRPAVFVAFLDIAAVPGASANGVCTPVDEAVLRVLDDRERNYERVEVTDHLAVALGRTWAYVGSTEGRARLRAGRARGEAVVSAAYRDGVDSAFRRLGHTEHAGAAPSLRTSDLPVLDLERIDLPAR